MTYTRASFRVMDIWTFILLTILLCASFLPLLMLNIKSVVCRLFTHHYRLQPYKLDISYLLRRRVERNTVISLSKRISPITRRPITRGAMFAHYSSTLQYKSAPILFLFIQCLSDVFRHSWSYTCTSLTDISSSIAQPRSSMLLFSKTHTSFKNKSLRFRSILSANAKPQNIR